MLNSYNKIKLLDIDGTAQQDRVLDEQLNLPQLLNNQNLLNRFRRQGPTYFPEQYIPVGDSDLKASIKNNPEWQACLFLLQSTPDDDFDARAPEKVSVVELLREDQFLDDFWNAAQNMFPEEIHQTNRRMLVSWIKKNEERLYSFLAINGFSAEQVEIPDNILDRRMPRRPVQDIPAATAAVPVHHTQDVTLFSLLLDDNYMARFKEHLFNLAHAEVPNRLAVSLLRQTVTNPNKLGGRITTRVPCAQLFLECSGFSQHEKTRILLDAGFIQQPRVNAGPNVQPSDKQRDIRGLINAVCKEKHFNSETKRQLERLREKTKDDAGLKQKYCFILEGLEKLQTAEFPDLGTEIAETIAGALDGDCVDHTSEVIDQITVALFLAKILHQRDGMRVDVGTLLVKMKLLFNEQALFEVMAEVRDSNGIQLIARKESTETRGYLKGKLSNLGNFPSNRFSQRYAATGMVFRDTMVEVENKFRTKVRSKEEFAKYLLSMAESTPKFRVLLEETIPGFKAGLRQREADVHDRFNEYDPMNTIKIHSVQSIIVAGAQVQQKLVEVDEEHLKESIQQQVRNHWEMVVKKTSN